jgi:hypothetical protein
VRLPKSPRGLLQEPPLLFRQLNVETEPERKEPPVL